MMRKILFILALFVFPAIVFSEPIKFGLLTEDNIIETNGLTAEWASTGNVLRSETATKIKTSDQAWITMSGYTGVICRVTREIGIIGTGDQIIITAISGDGYNGPAIGTVYGNSNTGLDPMSSKWLKLVDAHNNEIESNQWDIWLSEFNDGYPITWIMSNYTWDYSFYPDLPITLVSDGYNSIGEITIDWYGKKTVTNTIAILDDTVEHDPVSLHTSGGTMTGAIKLAESGITWQGIGIATNYTVRVDYDGTNTSFNIYKESK